MSHEEGGDKPREGYDQAALDEASRQLHMFFLREGSRYGTVACEEIGRVFMTAYLNASRSSVATNEPDFKESLDFNRLRSGDRRALFADHQPVFDAYYAALDAARSATARWKPDLKQCPYNGWPYPEREAWKAGYHNAMMDYTAFVQGEYVESPVKAAPHWSDDEGMQ